MSTTATFLQRKGEVEAMRFVDGNFDESFFRGDETRLLSRDGNELTVISGGRPVMTVYAGAWLIRRGDGLKVMSDLAFQRKYVAKTAGGMTIEQSAGFFKIFLAGLREVADCAETGRSSEYAIREADQKMSDYLLKVREENAQ